MKELEKAKDLKQEIKEALLKVDDELNQGQQKKLMKNEKVKALFERYGVTTA